MITNFRIPVLKIVSIKLSLNFTNICTQHKEVTIYSLRWNNRCCGEWLVVTDTDSVDQEEFPFSPLSWKLLTFTENGAPKPYKCPLELSMLSSKKICKITLLLLNIAIEFNNIRYLTQKNISVNDLLHKEDLLCRIYNKKNIDQSTHSWSRWCQS